MGLSSLHHTLPPWRRYLLAAAIFALALGLRLGLLPLEAERPYLTFYPALALAFYLCGGGPGWMMLALSVPVAYVTLMPPFMGLDLHKPGGLATALYVAAAAAIWPVIRQLHQRSLTLRDAQATLAVSEARFRSLAEVVPAGLFQSDSTGLCTYTNPRWQAIHGLGLAQGLGDGWLQAVHEDDRAAVEAAWRQAVASGGTFEMEYRIRRPGGALRHLQCKAQAFRADGVPAGHLGALTDVTELRDALQLLRTSEAFLDRTGRLASVGGWEQDLHSGTMTWTAQTFHLHDLPVGPAPSLAQMAAFYAPADLDRIAEATAHAVEHGVGWTLDLPMVTARGRQLWVHVVGEVELANGRPARLIGAIQDVTEQRQRQDELRREQTLRDELQRQAQRLAAVLDERNDMLDVLAHEVRQPLNNASAALQSAGQVLAQAGEGQAAQRLRRAQAVLGQVLGSLDNTLAVATLLVGGSALQAQDADLDTLLAVVVADMPAGERPRIRIERRTPTTTAAMDMNLMRLALRNLVGNALKFSPPGSPVVIRLADSDEPLALLIEVEDQGSGIAEALVPRIFERGVRDQSPGRPTGSGLGLYIVRRVMDLHGGQVVLVRNGPQGLVIRLVLVQ